MVYKKKNKLHIVTAVAVIRNSDGKYLLLKRHDNEVAYPGAYTFPGGKVEGNQTMDEALKEEVLEEAGLRLKQGKILLKDKSIARPDNQTSKSFSYLCEVEDDSEVVINDEFTDYMWASISDLANIYHVGLEEELRKADYIYSLDMDLSGIKTSSVKDDLTEK